jgi:hypothetical protein
MMGVIREEKIAATPGRHHATVNANKQLKIFDTTSPNP